MTKEVWKDIKGFEGLYQISNYGRVKSLTRVITEKPTGKTYTLKGRVMKPRKNNKSGYYQACMRKDGKYHYLYIHRLVADAFIKGTGDEVNHIDCNKGNNYYKNLEWCDKKGNVIHAVKNKRYVRGESHHTTSLKSDEVLKIKRLLKESDLTQKQIAAKFNTTKANISDIKREVTWKWLKLDERRRK